jgi:hypothetical protein
MRRDGRARGVEEPQPTLGCLANADAARNRDASGACPRAQRQGRSRLEQVPARQARVDLERAAEPPGTTERRRQQAASPQRLGRADQHAPRHAGSIHRQVEAVVHAVDEVDIQGSRAAEEGCRARSAPAMDVGRRVAHAQVGLGFDDARLELAPAQASHQHAANQGARGLRGREREKRPEPMPLTGCHAAEYRPRADEGCGGSSSGRLVVERASTAGTPDDPHRDRADHEPREGHDRHGRQQRQHHVNETQRILLDPSAGRTARKQPLPPLAAHAATNADATGRSGGGTSTG